MSKNRTRYYWTVLCVGLPIYQIIGDMRFVYKCHVLYLFGIFLHETIHSIGQDHGVQPSSVRKLVSLSLQLGDTMNINNKFHVYYFSVCYETISPYNYNEKDIKNIHQTV